MHTNTLDKRFMRPKEVARELGMSPDSVRRLIRQGDLPALRVAGRGSYLIRRSAVEQLLKPTTGAS